MIKKIVLGSCVVIALAAGIVWWLQKAQPVAINRGKLLVVCTTSIVADAVKNVGGDLVDVYALMGPGVDPHTYHARESDVQKLISANIIFYNGLHLEGKMGLLLERMGTQIPVCAVADGIDPSMLRQSQFAHAYDPHIWFDTTLWMECVKKIRDCLIQQDPAHSHEYETNAQIFLEKLRELNAYIKARVAVLPAHRRVLVTAHDAFSYFGRAYDFEIVSLQGISTDSEVGTYDVMRVVDYIVAHDVPAIFVEASIPQRNIEAVQNAVQAYGKTLVIGPTLYADALGSSGTVQETYLGMVRSVVDSIVNTLQGER